MRIQAYNFEAEVVDCPGRAFPTANGDLRPAYLSIGFNNDGLVANVTVETEPPTDTKPGDGYNCELARVGDHWRPQRCVRVTTLLFVDPPTPFPVP